MARKILLDQLTGRARSRHELADKLRGKDVPDEIATRLLDRFEEVGLVDDAAFAQAWVSGRQQGKGLAPRALAQELRRKGIDDETARDGAGRGHRGRPGRRGACAGAPQAALHARPRPDHRDPTPHRDAGPQGLLGPGLAFRVVKDELGADLSEES